MIAFAARPPNPGLILDFVSQAPALEPMSSKLRFVTLSTVFKQLKFAGDIAKQSFADVRYEAGASQRDFVGIHAATLRSLATLTK